MTSKEFMHEMPKELNVLLNSNKELFEKWNGLTEIAKNAWICYITIPKKEETKQKHLKRLKEDILSGEKRPCCWPGCPHRNLEAAKWFKKEVKTK